MEDTPSYTRLHITPLTPSLLPTILPPSILPQALNISYHQIPTFPERAYGYLDLPSASADKIKKKLHGSILQGQKVRIETARPMVEHLPSPREQRPEAPKQVKSEKDKKRKRKRDEVNAVDIGERQVKRGWTVPATLLVGREKEDKVPPKSKFTSKPECLFKTVLPPNVASQGAKEMKSMKGSRKGKEAVVHEFTKTTKYATFLRNSSGATKKKAVSEFVKGKGWVDEDGNVVEAIKGGTRVVRTPGLDVMDVDRSESDEDEDVPTRAERAMDVEMGERVLTKEEEGEQTLLKDVEKEDRSPTKEIVESSEDSSDEDSSSEEKDDGAMESTKDVTQDLNAVFEAKPPLEASSSDSDSDSSSSDSASESEEEEEEEAPAPATKEVENAASKESSSESDSESSSEDSPTRSTPTRPTIHPLEALYKRPPPTSTKPGNSNITSTPLPKPSAPLFNFTGDDLEDDDDQTVESQIPLTPFTKQDFEFRGMRSAAPTPDTAHANKRFIWPVDDEEDEDDEEEVGVDGASTPMKSKLRNTQGGEGAVAGAEAKEGEGEEGFQSWFYAHRGEANRAWKKRRKVVAKEKRQRENRKREERI